MKNVGLLTKKVLDLISEVERYTFYKQNFKNSLTLIFQEYQQGKYSYFEYEKSKKQLLKGATEEEWLKYYDSYVLALIRAALFQVVCCDQVYWRPLVSGTSFLSENLHGTLDSVHSQLIRVLVYRAQHASRSNQLLDG